MDTVDILNQAQIPYTLDAGTLLGIARDGDLIPWDNDIDLMLPVENVPDLRRVYGKILRRGWKVSRTYRMTRDSCAWKAGDPRVIKLRNWNPWLFGAGTTLLDITVIYRHQSAYWWDMANRLCRVPTEYFEDCEWIEYGGLQMRVPHQYKDYLTRLYGDWQTPDQNFHHNQFGTIVTEKTAGQ
ncbi:MAG: LicD family protein [Chromatiales bacterium]|jgi:phosphorylcholine metabolism protein LicD